MKDIIMKDPTIRRELIIWLILFLCAVGVNIYAILIYGGVWFELVAQLNIVVIVSIALYALVFLLRGLYYVFALPFKRKNNA